MDHRWDVSKAAGLKVTVHEHIVILEAETNVEAAMLLNARRFYVALAGEGVAPAVVQYGPRHLALERIDGIFNRHATRGELDFLWGSIRLLRAFDRHQIRHGDLTRKNLVLRDNAPLAIDFQEAAFWDENVEPKRLEDDAEHLWRAAIEITGDRDRRFRRWLAMRQLITGDVADLGANEGHFSALCMIDTNARSVVWVDHDVDLKAAAQGHDAASAYVLVDFRQRTKIFADTILLLSTWAHVAEQIGFPAARDWLGDLTENSGQLFFETQLAGDGPGPRELQTDDDVAAMFAEFGAEAQPLVTLPVAGREASRTLWRVRSDDGLSTGRRQAGRTLPFPL